MVKEIERVLDFFFFFFFLEIEAEFLRVRFLQLENGLR
mgnify:CR=1 FL=1